MRIKIALFIFSFILPGIGQVYNGQVIKAVVIFLIPYLLMLFLSIFGIDISFIWLVIIMVVIMLSRLFAAVDFYQKYDDSRLTKLPNRKYLTLGVGVLMILAQMVFDTNSILGVETFDISSPTMIPTLLPGDKIMTYTREKLPSYGHVVTFEVKNLGIWSYRVVGMPTDTIEILENRVIINGDTLKKDYIGNYLLDGVDLNLFKETSASGTSYTIQEQANIKGLEIEEIVLNKDEYYLLGDNRGNAQDSRYLGPILGSKIKGIVSYVYWNFDGSRVNIKI